MLLRCKRRGYPRGSQGGEERWKEGRKIDKRKKEEREEWMKGKKGGRKMKKKKEGEGHRKGEWGAGRGEGKCWREE